MNGFGGDVEVRLRALLIELGASEPIDSGLTIEYLRFESKTLLASINAVFFPMGAGLTDWQVTGETTVGELVLEITHKLAREEREGESQK